MTKVVAYITITKEFEHENPTAADFFANDYVERLKFTTPYDRFTAALSSEVRPEEEPLLFDFEGALDIEELLLEEVVDASE